MGGSKKIVDPPFVAMEEQKALVTKALLAFRLDMEYVIQIAHRASIIVARNERHSRARELRS